LNRPGFSGGVPGFLLKNRFFRAAAALVFCSIFLWLGLRFSPYPELETFLARPCSIRFYDRRGTLVQIPSLGEGLRREFLALEEIPGEVKAVFIQAEDRRFYAHPGVDPAALVRALFQNLRSGRRVSGASTITMQLARIIGEDRGGGLPRKIGETLNALRLEARLSKDEILELYLNAAPFGFQTEGTASAARTFFAAELSMLSPAQIFCLAVIPRRPGFYNPLDHPENCRAAAEELQDRFREDKKLAAAWPLLAAIGSGDWDYAVRSARRFDYPFEMPHFVRYVGGLLSGRAKAGTEGRARRSGPSVPPEVRLSADLELQRYVEGLVAGNVSRSYASRLTNGAAIVIDNESGEILAWVGSADYRDTGAAGQIDGVLALNQPGSSMKPFLYALALEKGFKPTDVLADIPMNFGEGELYIPQNFNNRFNGPMLFRSALASSLNIPAVYLLYRLGVRNYTEKLLSLGFDSLAAVSGAGPETAAERAGLGLALGNAPVSIAELVRAFSVFPRDGLLIPLTWEAGGGGGPPPEQRIFSADTARIICAFLSDPSARVLAFGSARNFQAPFPAIFKTGTANQYQSIAALGATPRFSAAVWMGNFTGETVIGRTGSSIPAAIVRDTLVFLQGDRGPGFAAPEHFSIRRVCALSGMAASPDCPSVVNEYAADEGPACTWHRGGATSYPAEYQAWFAAAARQGELDYHSRPLEILQPREGFVFFRNPGIGRDEIPVEVIGGTEDELEVRYDNSAFTVERPFVFYLPSTPGAHTLRVRNGGEEEEIGFSVE
jgi:penicillin-binding protein 1C